MQGVLLAKVQRENRRFIFFCSGIQLSIFICIQRKEFAMHRRLCVFSLCELSHFQRPSIIPEIISGRVLMHF
jgi:hypothetical protein